MILLFKITRYIDLFLCHDISYQLYFCLLPPFHSLMSTFTIFWKVFGVQEKFIRVLCILMKKEMKTEMS